MFFGGGRKIKNIFYTGLIIAAMFLSWNIAQTETETGNIKVDMSVPGDHCTDGIQNFDEGGVDCGGSCPNSCGGGVETYYPIIFNVASSTNFYQATVSWEVNFRDKGINNTTSIIYGKNFDLTSTTVVIASGTEFFVIINDLEADTTYDFKISASNSSKTAEVPGNFRTQKVIILNSLTILAKPEKRVPKIGGNFGVSQATIFFLDQSAGTILSNFTTMLENTGTTTFSNVAVPSGTALVAVLKTDSHLGKRLNGVDTTGENLVLDFTVNDNFKLLAGDMAGNIDAIGSENLFAEFLQAERQDDFVDILDLSSVVSKFNNQTVGERTNLNGDNIVDSLDISIVLGNWNKEGDIIVK